MDYTYTILAAEMLRRAGQSRPAPSSFEEEIRCMREEQASRAKAQDVAGKNDRPARAEKRPNRNHSWFQWFAIGSGTN